MKLADSQKQIIRLFEGDFDKVLTTTELCEYLGGMYYMNEAKYISERCSRLVKAGWLIRTKRGHFKLGTGKKQKVETETNPNQLNLFS